MAEVSTAVLDRLANEYSMALSRIQMAAEAAALDAWFTHSSFDSDTDEEWEDEFWSILLAAGLAIEVLTATYYQAQRDYIGIGPRVTTPRVTDALRDQFEDYQDSPAVRARYLVSEGIDPTEAITDAGPRVRKLSYAATRYTEQAALAELMEALSFETVWTFEDDVRPDELFTPEDNKEVDALHRQLRGQYRMSKVGKGQLKWKRSPQANACGYCRAQAGRLLTDESHDRDTKWHTYCRCGWRELTARESRSFETIDSGEFRRLAKERFDDEGQGTE